MILLLIPVLGLVMAGCATVTRGTTNSVTISSDPSGADAVVSTGQHCPSTPCTFDISRKTEFIVTFSKSGYKTVEVPVKTQLAGTGAAGFAGNVLVGGLIGMGVDAATGSTLEHVPNPVFVKMELLGKAKAAPKAAKPKKDEQPATEKPQS